MQKMAMMPARYLLSETSVLEMAQPLAMRSSKRMKSVCAAKSKTNYESDDEKSMMMLIHTFCSTENEW